MTIPESSVTLTVPVDSLRALPEGAIFRAHDGRAGVEVRHLPATGSEPARIEVRATSDSLQMMMEHERSIIEIDEGERRSASEDVRYGEDEQPQSSVEKKSGLKTAWRGFEAGAVFALIAIIIIRIKFKKR